MTNNLTFEKFDKPITIVYKNIESYGLQKQKKEYGGNYQLSLKLSDKQKNNINDICEEYDTFSKIKEDSNILYLKIKQKDMTKKILNQFLEKHCLLHIRLLITGFVKNEDDEKYLVFPVKNLEKVKDIETEKINDDMFDFTKVEEED